MEVTGWLDSSNTWNSLCRLERTPFHPNHLVKKGLCRWSQTKVFVFMMLVDMTFCRVSKECILEYIVILALVHFSPMAGSFNTTTTTESMKNTSSPSSCVVPAYSQPLFEVNATEENTKLFLTEGMCYLLCLQVVYEVRIINTFSLIAIVGQVCQQNHIIINVGNHQRSRLLAKM